MGGPFIVDNFEEMKQIPIERLVKGCKCTVNEHTTNGVLSTTTTYLLKSLPNMRLSDMVNPNISEYWILDKPMHFEETVVEYQYAMDYQGTRPPFLTSVITREAYNAGYATNADFAAGNVSNKIWVSGYDVNTHKWVRQRTGSTADWGIPMKIDEGYEEGSYNEIRFQWRDKNLGKPARPASRVNGKPNNIPEGWSETPAVPSGTTYNVYVQTFDLWRISAIKGVYGDLITEWSDPVVVSTNPMLVRYGKGPKSTEYLNDTYWRGYFSIGDRYQATRAHVNSPWRVERIFGESGEYVDYVFKQFPNSYEPTLADAPTTTLGYGTNNWFDGVFNSAAGFTLYVSSARKYSNGELATPWSLPVRFDGLNTIRCVIAPFDNSGNVFKYINENGVETISPASIKLRAKVFDGSDLVPATNYTVKWYFGNATGTQIIKGAPNNPVISGAGDSELTILPAHVNNLQVITAVAIFGEEDYVDEITLFDVTDGLGYIPIIDSTTGVIYKGTETKTFTAYFYENGTDISTATGVAYEWLLNGAVYGTGRTVQVNNNQVTGITNLKLRVTFRGEIYRVTEALTDVVDGKSLERRYSALETINLNHTPDTLNNPAAWSTSSAGAIWIIERMQGEVWGIPYRVKGENGVPSGAFQKTVYRTHAPNTVPNPDWRHIVPTKKTDPNSNLTPTFWTDNPAANPATGSTIWGTRATFMKNVTNTNTQELVRNWDIVGEWSMPFRVTHFPAAAPGGEPGKDGFNGWTPVPSIVDKSGSTTGERVIRIVDWTGGGGTKPPVNVFVGPNGLLTTDAQAINIRGIQGIPGAPGSDGVFKPTDFWLDAGHTINITTGGVYKGAIIMRKARNGMVYYQGFISENTRHIASLPLGYAPMDSHRDVRDTPVLLTGTWVKKSTTHSESSVGWDNNYKAFIARSGATGSMAIHVYTLDDAQLMLSGCYLTSDAMR